MASTLNRAKREKKDEFYTKYSDIESEIRHFKSQFLGKTVYCNCDDPTRSNFFRFFAENFHALELKKLFCTCYNGVPTKENPHPKALLAEITSDNCPNEAEDFDVNAFLQRNPPVRLKGNGDFRSDECHALLQEADIAVTNPPFSLMRDYISLMVEQKKQFLIVAPINSLGDKEIFSLLNEDKIGLGYKFGSMKFQVPSDYASSSAKQDAEGKLWRDFGNICWITNLDGRKRNEEISLSKNYTKQEYPFFDNFPAISVSQTKDIPKDYFGLMGVPITFLNKYNPKQFQIVGNEYSLNVPKGRCYLHGKRLYSRIFIRRCPANMKETINLSSEQEHKEKNNEIEQKTEKTSSIKAVLFTNKNNRPMLSASLNGRSLGSKPISQDTYKNILFNKTSKETVAEEMFSSKIKSLKETKKRVIQR